MPKLKEIATKIETTFHIKVNGSFPEEARIKGIRFLDGSNRFEPSYLYLGKHEQIKEETSAFFLMTCCSKSLKRQNTLCIEEDVSLFQLFNLISEMIDVHEKYEQKKKNLYSLLRGNSSLFDLLRRANKEIGSPMIILDSSYTVLEMSLDFDTSGVFEKRRNRITMKKEFVEKMENELINEKLYASSKPFPVQLSDLNYNGVFVSVKINKLVVGYIFVRTNEKTLNEEELDYLYCLSEAVSIQMQKNNSSQSGSWQQDDVFFNDLLLGHYKEEKTIIAKIKELKIIPKKEYFFVACGFKENAKKPISNSYYLSELSLVFDNSLITVRDDFFLLFVSTNDFEGYINRISARFKSFLKLNGLLATVSYRFNRLTFADDYASQATAQLKRRISHHEDSGVFHYRHFFFEHMIYISNHKKEIEASLHPSITEMLSYDKENNTNYIETLRAYFENNRNAPMTAQALYIHKTTLFYRFNKMKKLFNIKFDDNDSLFAYEYSLRILKITNR